MSLSVVPDDHPEVLASVALRLGLTDTASAEVPTRVTDLEDVDGVRRVVVNRPDLSGLVGAGTFPHPGQELALLWSRSSGRLRRPVTATAESRHYGPVWVLTPTGPPVREQRRQFFRVPLTLPAVLTRDGATARATLVEISEGGAVLCSNEWLPPVGTVLGLTFDLDDTTVAVEAEVLRHKDLPTGRPSAAVRFLDPTAYGDRIRRYAFALQRSQARSPIR